MPEFSRESKSELETAHGDLRVISNFVIRYYDFTVTEGVRSKTRQNNLYQRNKTKVRWPNSKHNVGEEAERDESYAIDVAPYPIDWEDRRRFVLLAGMFIMTHRFLQDHGIVDYNLRWGGNWDMDEHLDDQIFDDLGHFELVE